MAYIRSGVCGDCAGHFDQIVECDNGYTYCRDCALNAVASGYLSPNPMCADCGDSEAEYCEYCAITGCSNCGSREDSMFCSAECANSYWGESDNTWCIQCGDSESAYCSVGCATYDTGEAYCLDCDSPMVASCRDCLKKGSTYGDPILISLASEPMAGVSDTQVELDGVTFEFDL
jgi:hypothetical protein